MRIFALDNPLCATLRGVSSGSGVVCGGFGAVSGFSVVAVRAVWHWLLLDSPRLRVDRSW